MLSATMHFLGERKRQSLIARNNGKTLIIPHAGISTNSCSRPRKFSLLSFGVFQE